MSQAHRFSFYFILAALVLAGWLHLGVLVLAVLFSYFIITKLNFMKPRGKWLAVAVFLVLLAALSFALDFFVRETVRALPRIADKSIPAVISWANDHGIQLPFTDLASLEDQAFEFARNEARNIGEFADFARGATTQFLYLFVGCIVAIGLFINPQIELRSGAARDNLYSRCCEEISHRFATFYASFSMVMNAQISISAINTLLTGIFMACLGLPHQMVAVGLTFLCGFLPVIGNLLSNIVVVAIAFTISPNKGLAALVFLVGIHKMEYFLNSKIIGAKIHSPIWLTLLGLVVGERLMGVTGMVLAPVVLHYIRVETSKIPVGHGHGQSQRD